MYTDLTSEQIGHKGNALEIRRLSHIFAARKMRGVDRRVFVSDVGAEAGNRRLFAFGYADLAELLGFDEARQAAQHMLERGYHPGDLESVCRCWLERVRSPNYTRRWRGDAQDAVLDSEHRSAKRKRKVSWTDPKTGKAKGVELPDPEDL